MTVMKTIAINHMKVSMFIIFAFLAAMIYNGSAHAGDYGMKTNLSEMANLMSRWSKQLSTGKVEPKAQEMMGEIMSRMSKVLQELTGSESSDMHMQHHGKIMKMKKDWDPFDTTGDGGG